MKSEGFRQSSGDHFPGCPHIRGDEGTPPKKITFFSKSYQITISLKSKRILSCFVRKILHNNYFCQGDKGLIKLELGLTSASACFHHYSIQAPHQIIKRNVMLGYREKKIYFIIAATSIATLLSSLAGTLSNHGFIFMKIILPATLWFYGSSTFVLKAQGACQSLRQPPVFIIVPI